MPPARWLKSYTYIEHGGEKQFGRRWDDVGKVPWYRYWDNAADHWVQGYYDDVASLGAKYDLINARGLAGTGMWTLLMDRGRDELWRLLANKFVRDGTAGRRRADHAGHDRRRSAPGPLAGARLRVGGQQLHRPVPPQPRRWRTAGRQQEDQRWFAGEAGSTFEFRVRAVDLKGNAQSWVTVPGKPAKVKAGAFARVSAPT